MTRSATRIIDNSGFLKKAFPLPGNFWNCWSLIFGRESVCTDGLWAIATGVFWGTCWAGKAWCMAAGEGAAWAWLVEAAMAKAALFSEALAETILASTNEASHPT